MNIHGINEWFTGKEYDEIATILSRVPDDKIRYMLACEFSDFLERNTHGGRFNPEFFREVALGKTPFHILGTWARERRKSKREDDLSGGSSEGQEEPVESKRALSPSNT